jgi:hypothetical protein
MLTGVQYEAVLTPEHAVFFEEILQACRTAWNEALNERQRAKHAGEAFFGDYRQHRDDVLEDIRLDYPDVPAAPVVEALKRLDQLCNTRSDIHAVLDRSSRGRRRSRSCWSHQD